MSPTKAKRAFAATDHQGLLPLGSSGQVKEALQLSPEPRCWCTRDMDTYEIVPIGWLESELTSRVGAPMQGIEGAPPAWLNLQPEFAAGIEDVAVGDQLVILTWLHLASRETLKVHPRDDESAPLAGVFSTRSPERPNPIGLHPVTVLEIDGLRLLVSDMEAVDGTPIIDIKPKITR